MGRSVSRPYEAYLWVYTTIDSEDEFSYKDLVTDIRETFKAKFPSFDSVDIWLHDEDKIILSNKLVQIGLSTYFDIVCIWVVLVDSEENINLALNFIDKLKPTLHEFKTLEKQGTMSNGVSVYTKVKK